MQTFKEFLSRQDNPFSVSKKEIITYWQSIEPNQPIVPQPIPIEKEGSTYGFDGIRITGSIGFIESILSRFKDFLYKESPTTKLNVVMRNIESKEPGDLNTNKYVFYVNVGERGKGKAKVPKLPKPKFN